MAKGLKINISFFILLVIALIALINDYIIYFFNINYLIGLLISFFSIGFLSIILIKKKIVLLRNSFKKYDIFFFLILSIMFFMIISYADGSYDVVNYHIYLQENFKVDKLFFDFIPTNVVNCFLFPLGDRMYYIFRYFLGYRLGTILSFYSYIVIYYQVKNIIISIMKKEDKFTDFLSCVCVFSSTILFIAMGSYYIDVFSVAFLLFIVNKLLNYKNDNDNKNHLLILLSLVSGISVGIKVSNGLLLIPLFIWIIIVMKPDKKMIKYIIISFFIFLIPFFLYMLDNYLQTGSVMFPYYNNILKSKYFGLFSWKQPRFGIGSLFNYLIWPIYTSSIKLGYGDDFYLYDFIWAFGYIINVIYVLYVNIRKKEKGLLYKTSLISLVLTLFWILFLEGYMRYALVIPVLYSIVLSVMILKFFDSKRILNIICISTKLISILSLIILISLFIYNKDYSLLFVDREKVTIKIDGVWGIIMDETSYTTLVREEGTPIYNLDLVNVGTSDVTKKMYYERIKNNKIYVLISKKNHDAKVKMLQDNNFELDELIKTYTYKELPFLNTYNEIELYTIKLTSN